MIDLPRSNITQCGDLLRANVWTQHGASSKTFRTVSEAQAWIAVTINRKPMGQPND